MAQAWHVKEHQGIIQIDMDVPNTEVNVLTMESMKELSDLLKTLHERKDLKAILFTGAKKKIFIAGADIKEINNIRTPEDAFRKAEDGKSVFQLIEDFNIPTICVIHGACLGGGYELALACSHRVAADSEQVKIGLPEVNLGILPGFGGSIRMPRLLGLQKALPLILGGKIVSAKRAYKAGMVDRLYPEKDLLEKSFAWARELAGRKPRRPVARPIERFITGPLLIYPAAKAQVLKQTKGFYPAPLKTLELIQRTYGKPLKEAFEQESRAFSELGATEVSKNLIHLFFLSERYKKQAWTSLKDAGTSVKSCGIIGAGVMGGGIAQLVSTRDLPVSLRDINEKALEGALKEAQRIYQGAVERKKMSLEASEQKMKLIQVGASEAEIAQKDIIIEAVVEDLEIKRKVFKGLSEAAPKTTILASNTSSLSVSRMAEVCQHPERVIGMHFFNPVHRMPLIEVIRAKQTSEETVERTVRFSRFLGKTVIVVQDAPGFLVNRLLMPYLNEAAYMLSEGISAETIDRTAKKFGMPMGPIELADQVGIDVCYKVAHILEGAFGSRMKTAGILEQIMKAGSLGKKAGKGFYVYDPKGKKPNPEWIQSKSAKQADPSMMIKRLIYIMINEAARCLDEKVIDSAATVDIGMIMGTGFPPFRGGLLRYADSVGAPAIIQALQALSKSVSEERFEPCAYLRRLADEKKNFYA